MQDDKQKEMSVVCLPGDSFVVQQWLVRNGSAVRRGEKVAIAVQKGTAAPTSVQPPTTVKHKRPNKRKRGQAVPKEESKSTESSADTAIKPSATSISAYLPPTPQHTTITAPSGGIIRISPLPENPLAIASIEPCPHPAIMSGLCAVCGASIQPQPFQATFTSSNSTATNNSNNTMSQVTVSGGVTMTISETEARQMSLQTSSRLMGERKLSLVLDLDHTLVHATSDARAQSHHAAREDVRTLILPIQMNAQTLWMQHFVKLRPHVEEFLTSLQSTYEISVYTAGTRIYAEHVCMLLSRTIVGATLDEAELQHLRHGVASAEYKIAQKEANFLKAKKDLNSNDDDSIPSKLSTANEGNDSESAATTNGTTTKSDKDTAEPPPPKKKKKKVSFGEPPEETKTDEMTSEKLQQLQQLLQEAEALEQKALDLRQEIFASRIVSRTDVGDLGRDVKSLERIFPCGGSMALIVDDREDVWANAQDNSKRQGEPPDNLLLIRPYHWKPFLGFADVNNAAGEDISGESTTTEDENDVALMWTRDILERMHSKFYAAVEKNDNGSNITVPRLIRDMRTQVLKGCTLVFSGLIPLYQQNQTSQFPRPAVVRYGESLGATVRVVCRNESIRIQMYE
jgi:RNA polymerase II subunit A-like phosphatase